MIERSIKKNQTPSRPRGGETKRGPTGPFADADHPWEPLPAGGQISTCALRDQLPRSLDTASGDCQGGYCHHVIRLDSHVAQDPATGRWWLAYAWYTNTPPLVEWETANHGEHVSLVELDAADPFAVVCDTSVAQVHAGNPHDAATLAALGGYCDGCDDMLSSLDETRPPAPRRRRRGGRGDRALQRGGAREGPAPTRHTPADAANARRGSGAASAVPAAGVPEPDELSRRIAERPEQPLAGPDEPAIVYQIRLLAYFCASCGYTARTATLVEGLLGDGAVPPEDVERYERFLSYRTR